MQRGEGIGMFRVRHVCDLPGEAVVLGFCLPGVWVWVLVTSRWLRGQGRFLCWSEGAAEHEMAARIPKLDPVIHIGCFGQQAVRVGRSVLLLLCSAPGSAPQQGQGAVGWETPAEGVCRARLPPSAHTSKPRSSLAQRPSPCC